VNRDDRAHCWVTSQEFQDWIGELIKRYENESERLQLLLHEQVGQDARVEAAQIRLRESVDQADALEGIREIVANLFGSEEMVLFGVEPVRAIWWTMWSFGVTDPSNEIWESLSTAVTNTLFAGELYLANPTAAEPKAGSNVTAFVPIRVEGQTVAVLVILRLLRQKTTIDEADLDLLRVITEKAGSVLFKAA
jgi:hypothetical protein